MSIEIALVYFDAKARVVRAINLVTTFVRASMDFNDDRLNAEKRAKKKNVIRIK